MEEKNRQRLRDLNARFIDKVKSDQRAAEQAHLVEQERRDLFKRLRREVIRPVLEAMIQDLRAMGHWAEISEEEGGSHPSGTPLDKIDFALRPAGRHTSGSQLLLESYGGGPVTAKWLIEPGGQSVTPAGYSCPLDKLNAAWVEERGLEFVEKVFAVGR